MNKRGQIYLVAAIVFCMLAFLVVSQPNFIRERILLQNFKSLSNNYLTESPKVVNTVLEESQPGVVCSATDSPELCEIKDKLSGFTDKFVDEYAKNQDPNIGLVYIYSDKNGIVIQNSLNGENLHINGVQSTGGPIEATILPTTAQVTGDMTITGAGVGLPTGTNLCVDQTENYCILEEKSLEGEVTLKIGDINYKFKVTKNSPELIVIVKSKDKDVVKVDVSENKL